MTECYSGTAEIGCESRQSLQFVVVPLIYGYKEGKGQGVFVTAGNSAQNPFKRSITPNAIVLRFRRGIEAEEDVVECCTCIHQERRHTVEMPAVSDHGIAISQRLGPLENVFQLRIDCDLSSCVGYL